MNNEFLYCHHRKHPFSVIVISLTSNKSNIKRDYSRLSHLPVIATLEGARQLMIDIRIGSSSHAVGSFSGSCV